MMRRSTRKRGRMTLFTAIAALALAVLALIGVCAMLPHVTRDREYRDRTVELDEEPDI